MICKNCGAHFDDNLPECPYCGAFHYAGARKEYMGKLEGMREDLDDLHETVPEMYAAELKKQGKHARKIVLIILAVLGALALLLFGVSSFMDSLYKTDAKAELLFTKEAFPIADEYYAAGDYEGLLEFYQTSIEENENASFYNWDHYQFLVCYENLTIFNEVASRLESADFTENDMRDLFFCYISSHFYLKGYPMDHVDLQLVSSFMDEMETVIDSLTLSKEELKEFNDLLNSTGHPSWDEIKDFSKKVYKRIY